MGKEAIGALGLKRLYPKLAPAFHVKLSGFAVSYCLTRSCAYGILLIEAVEAVSDGNARYIGVRLEPGKK